jgi:signal transduction histidine kinase
VQLIKPLIDENLTIQCRPSEISQVLLNLLNNAFDAVEDLPQRWVKIDVKEVDDQVNLTVTDSGQGIDVALRDKIMQPFFTTKPVGKGTGLGLSISSGIVESHHGKFVLDPKSPFTSFQMTLPKRQNSFFS